MKIINPSYKIEQCPTYQEALSTAERAARTCYKSEDKIDDGYDSCRHCSGEGVLLPPSGRVPCPHCNETGRIWVREPSAIKLIRACLARHHESVIEHVASISVRFICDRGVSHELVRHRLASFSQESTRYCNYGKAGDVTFIRPGFWSSKPTDDQQHEVRKEPFYSTWESAMSTAERCYLLMIEDGASPQEARTVLPNSLKTEVVMTANIREWRLIFQLRTSKAAHPQMRELMVPLLAEMKQRLPVFFEDINLAETE